MFRIILLLVVQYLFTLLLSDTWFANIAVSYTFLYIYIYVCVIYVVMCMLFCLLNLLCIKI